MASLSSNTLKNYFCETNFDKSNVFFEKDIKRNLECNWIHTSGKAIFLKPIILASPLIVFNIAQVIF